MLVKNISLNLLKVTHAVSVDRNIPYFVMPLARADKVCINLLGVAHPHQTCTCVFLYLFFIYLFIYLSDNRTIMP